MVLVQPIHIPHFEILLVLTPKVPVLTFSVRLSQWSTAPPTAELSTFTRLG